MRNLIIILLLTFSVSTLAVNLESSKDTLPRRIGFALLRLFGQPVITQEEFLRRQEAVVRTTSPSPAHEFDLVAGFGETPVRRPEPNFGANTPRAYIDVWEEVIRIIATLNQGTAEARRGTMNTINVMLNQAGAHVQIIERARRSPRQRLHFVAIAIEAANDHDRELAQRLTAELDQQLTPPAETTAAAQAPGRREREEEPGEEAEPRRRRQRLEAGRPSTVRTLSTSSSASSH